MAAGGGIAALIVPFFLAAYAGEALHIKASRRMDVVKARICFFMDHTLTTTSPLRKQFQPTRASAAFKEHGDVAEWSKALAWKVSIRQKRIEGSNPSVSARTPSAGVLHRPVGLTNPQEDRHFLSVAA
jgi:hypothetical protein